MKKILTENLGLKILAVVISACLWLISININDPISQDTYNLTVQLQNVNKLNAIGKYVEVADSTDKVRVTVRASRSILTSLSEENIVATADLTKIDENNQVPIEITTNKSSDKIESLKSDRGYVSVNIEDISKVQLPIEVLVQNEPAAGYILGNTNTAQNVVIVSGPESAMKNISYAAVEINVADAKSDVNITLPIHLYDVNGNMVDVSKLTMNKTEVSTTAGILETKQIPVICDIQGEVLDGYVMVDDVVCDPNIVTVSGRSSTLKKLNEIRLTDLIDVTGCENDIVTNVDIKEYLPEGVSVVSGTPSEVTVKVDIEKEQKRDISLAMKHIHVTNIPDGYEAVITEADDPILLELFGEKAVLDSINADELVGIVDMAAYMENEGIETLSTGTLSVPMTVALPDNARLGKEVYIRVKVTK